MARDRSKFAKIQEPSVEGFAKWVLSESFQNRKTKLETFDEALLIYFYHHERTVINWKNYKYWVEWMKKNRAKALLLYPCHCIIFMEKENEFDSFQRDGY